MITSRDRTGHIPARCHKLQSNTPLEDIIAHYAEAWHDGCLS